MYVFDEQIFPATTVICYNFDIGRIIIVMFGLFLFCGFREDSKYIFLVIFIGQISIINTLTISQNIPENMSSN